MVTRSPPLKKFRAELELVRRTFHEFGLTPEIYVEGNHDYEFGQAGEIEGLLGCPVSPSLVHRDDETGLVMTHGHVSEMPEVERLIRNAGSAEGVVHELSLDRLKEALEISALRYDVVGVVTNQLERGAGRPGIDNGLARVQRQPAEGFTAGGSDGTVDLNCVTREVEGGVVELEDGEDHFYASYRIDQGMSVMVLQERFGHADVATTMRFYIHSSQESHR